MDGRVVSIYGGVGSAGRGSIISLNLGNQDGLEIGHVLALERNRTVTQRDENDQKINVQIPAERTGLVFVFRRDRGDGGQAMHEGVVPDHRQGAEHEAEQHRPRVAHEDPRRWSIVGQKA